MAMILDGQFRLASPVSPLGERRPMRFMPLRSEGGWLEVQLAFSRRSDDESWAPVLLRTGVDVRVFLAALMDRGGVVREWLEVWFQSPPETANGRRTAADCTNAAVDARWEALVAGMLQSDRGSIILTGCEKGPATPLWMDVERGEPWPVASKEGQVELCTDEAALASAGLASYAGSAKRYLWCKNRAADGFFCVSAEGAASQPIPAWAAPAGKLVPVNPLAGRMLVRRHAPFDLDTYADFLSGRGLGRVNTNSPFVFFDPDNQPPLDACDQLQQSGAFLIPTTRGLAGRFLETFHLKLLMFAHVVRAVRTGTEALQMPMLGLSSSSFRIDFAHPASDLPILWTAKASLVDAPMARAIPVALTEKRKFQRIAEPKSMIYSAPMGPPAPRGECALRIRKIVTESGRVSLQATLGTDEYLAVRGSDLLHVELPLADGSIISVHGQLDATEALSVHERRFQSFPLECTANVQAGLARLEGHVLRNVRFDVVEQLGSRHDLYSLGVIGTRILLTHSRHSLAESIDEILSLARSMGRVDGLTAPLRAQQLALADARWHTALGPQHHGHGCATPEEGYRWVPMELWWDAVATIARFFPGAGVFSYTPDFNDPNDLPLHKTFDEPLHDLERLIQYSRSLLLSDWLANREVARVIQRLR